MRRSAARLRLRLALFLVASGAAGCGGGTTEPPGPDSLDATGSTTLTGATSAQVGPLEVRLTDDDGDPRAGVNVTWAAAAGSGSLSAVSTPTNADGRASVTWTLGPAAGTHTVTATVQGLTPITFTATVTFQTLEPTVNISISGNLSVDRIIIPAGVTVTITGPTTIDVEGAVQILGTLTGNCHALVIRGDGAGTIAGTIANHCAAAGAAGGDLEFTVNGDLIVTGTIRSSGNVLIRNTDQIDEADLDAFFQSPPRAAPLLQAVPPNECTWDGAEFLGPDGEPQPAPAGQDGSDGPDFTAICSGDAVLNEPDFDVGAEGQDGGAAPPPPAAPGPVSGSGGNGGAGPDFSYYTNGDLTINPEGSGILRLARGGDGGDADVVATAPGQSATAAGGDGGNGGGMRIGAGGGITIANTLTIVTGGGGHGGDASATGAKGNDGTTAASQPGGNATANGGNGGNTTEGRLRAQGAVSGVINIVLDDGGNYGDGGNGGNATAIAGQGGHGGAADPNGAIGGDMIAGGGDGGEVRTQGLSGAFVGDGGDGGDITVGGAGGGSPTPTLVASLALNVPPLRAPSMGGNGVDRCPPFTEGGDGGGGGSVLSNAAQGEPSQPGEGGDEAPGVTSDGDDGSIEVLDETGVGGQGGDGAPPGDGGAAGNGDGLGAGFSRVNGSPIFEPGSPGQPCNTPPVLQEQATATTPKNTPVNVTLAYADEENDLPNTGSATVNNITPAGAGTVTNFAVVSIPPSGTGLRFTFTPANDFVGTVTFQVAVNDARGALSNVANVQVTVTDTAPGAIRDMRQEFNGVNTTPGVTSTQTMTDVATSMAVGNMGMRPQGDPASHFFGSNPALGGDRVGMLGDPDNLWAFHLIDLSITGDPNANVEEAQFCFVNTSGVNGGNPITISFFGAAASAPPLEDAGSSAPARFPGPIQMTGDGCTGVIEVDDATRVEIGLMNPAILDLLEPVFGVETTFIPAAG